MTTNEKFKPDTLLREEISQLAIDIDGFMQEFDQYGYWDKVGETVEDIEVNVEAVSSDIASGNTEHIREYLREAILEYEDVPGTLGGLEQGLKLLNRLDELVKITKLNGGVE